jgi:hypothetical protein
LDPTVSAALRVQEELGEEEEDDVQAGVAELATEDAAEKVSSSRGWQSAGPVLADLGGEVKTLSDIPPDTHGDDIDVDKVDGVKDEVHQAARPSGWEEEEEGEEGEDLTEYADAEPILPETKPPVNDAPAATVAATSGWGETVEDEDTQQQQQRHPAAQDDEDTQQQQQRQLKKLIKEEEIADATMETGDGGLAASAAVKEALEEGRQPITTFFVGLRVDRTRVLRGGTETVWRPPGSEAVAAMRIPPTLLDTWAEQWLGPYDCSHPESLGLAASVMSWRMLPARVFEEVGEVAGASRSPDGTVLEALLARRRRAIEELEKEDQVLLAAKRASTWTGGATTADPATSADSTLDAITQAAMDVSDAGALPGLDDKGSEEAITSTVMPGVMTIEGASARTTATAHELSVTRKTPVKAAAAFTGTGLPGLSEGGEVVAPVAVAAEDRPVKRPRAADESVAPAAEERMIDLADAFEAPASHAVSAEPEAKRAKPGVGKKPKRRVQGGTINL